MNSRRSCLLYKKFTEFGPHLSLQSTYNENSMLLYNLLSLSIFAMLSQFSLPDNIKICCQYLRFSISDSWGAEAKMPLWSVDSTSSSLLTLERRIWSFNYKTAPSTLPARCNLKLLNYVLWHLGAKVIKAANEPLLTAHVLLIFGEWYLIDVWGQSSIV